MHAFVAAVCFLFLFLPYRASAQILSAGYLHTLAVCEDGTVNAWGSSCNGQLGLGYITPHHAPFTVAGPTDIMAVAAGTGFSLVVGPNGAWTFGDNQKGELGNGSTVNASAPVQVTGLDGAIACATGTAHAVVLKADGTLWSWGWGFSGQLGTGNFYTAPCYCDSLPAPITGITDVVAIAAGSSHNMAIKNDGTLWVWGYDNWGALGLPPPYYSRYTPVQVPNMAGVVAIAAGHDHSLAVKNDGTLWAWGMNDHGQLGDGTDTLRWEPVQVPGLTDVVAVYAGGYRSMALTSDGTMWAFGDNTAGQLGDGTTIDRWSPVPLSGFNGALRVACGWEHTIALGVDGALHGCGHNADGELANGTLIDEWLPVDVIGACALVVPTSLPADPAVEVPFIAPNPTSGLLRMEGLDAVDELGIRDALGQEVYHTTVLRPTMNIDLSDQPDGIYLVSARSGSTVRTMRAVKQ